MTTAPKPPRPKRAPKPRAKPEPQAALPLPKPKRPPAPPRLIISIDPATTDGAAAALYCPGSAEIAQGAKPALIAVWSWRASTAKAAGDGVRLGSAVIDAHGIVRPVDGDPYPSHPQIGAAIAHNARAIIAQGVQVVIACEAPHATRFTVTSATAITWVSGLIVGPILAAAPSVQLIRPTVRRWRSGLDLDPAAKPVASQIAPMLAGGIPTALAAALHGRHAEDAALPDDVVEAIAIGVWAGITEGRPPKRAAKPRKAKVAQPSA